MAIKEFITLEGVDQVKRALDEINVAGEESLKQFRDLGSQTGGAAFNRLVQGAKDAGLQLDDTTEKTTKLSQAFKIVKPLAQLFGVELGNIGSFAKIASNSLVAFGATAVGGIVVALGKLEESAAKTRGQLDDLFKGRGEQAFSALTQQAQTFGTTVGGLLPGLTALQTALANVDRAAQGFVALKAENLPSGLAAPSIDAVTKAYENFIKILRAGRLSQDEAEKSAAAFFNTMKEGGNVTKAALQALPIGTLELLKQALGAAGQSNKQFFDAVESGAISVDKLRAALTGFSAQAQKAFDTKAVKTMGDELGRVLVELSAGFQELSGKPFSDFVIGELARIRQGIRDTKSELDKLLPALGRIERATEIPGLGQAVRALREPGAIPGPTFEETAAAFAAEADISKQTTAIQTNNTVKKENVTTTRDLAAAIKDLAAAANQSADAIQRDIDAERISVDEGIRRLDALRDAQKQPAEAVTVPKAKFVDVGEAQKVGADAAAAFGKGWVNAVQSDVVQPTTQALTTGLQTGLQDAIKPDFLRSIIETIFGPDTAKQLFDPIKQEIPAAQQEIVSAFQQTGVDAGINFSQGLQQTPVDFSGLTQGIQTAADAATQLAQALYDRIKSIFAQPIPVAFSGFGGAAEGAPFAGGGRVIGPGSWTSDSILARLSRDEFVQPAMRVHQYGMDFMEAIRRGLLSTDAVRALMGDFRGLRFGGSAFPRFAEGGAITTGGSRTLNLILGGQTFPVSGSAKVIDSLEREAALRSMASTGIAQSFVGRR